ncbi:MAG: glycoside hydrolase family 99-like domain-containing protein [bacterium]|nr:glycoside hydrolase family 99-like domain-containing protein [bacterium]
MIRMKMRTSISIFFILLVLRAGTGDAGQKTVMAHYLAWFQSKDDPLNSFWGPTWAANGHTPDAVDSLTGQRDISAKDYPLIGPYDSNDFKSLEYHILLAQACGLRGFIVDYFGTNSSTNPAVSKHGFEVLSTNVLYLNGLNNHTVYSGFRICLSYDEQALNYYPSSYKSAASNDLLYVKNNYSAKPWYYTNQGSPKPMLVIWPYESRLTHAEWTNLLNRFTNYFCISYKEYGSEPSMATHYPWLNGFTTDGLGWGEAYLDSFYTDMGVNPIVQFCMGGVWPGFDESGWKSTNIRIIDRRDLEVYRNTWNKVSLYSGGPGLDLVQVITWNDWGEGTEIEPSVEYQYRYIKETRDQINAYCSELLLDDRAFLLPQYIYNARLAVAQSISASASGPITNAIKDFYSGDYHSGLTNATRAMGTTVPVIVSVERANRKLNIKWNRIIGACRGYRVYAGTSSNYLEMKDGFSATTMTNAALTNVVLTNMENSRDYYCAVSSFVGSKINESRYRIEGWTSPLLRSGGDSTAPLPVHDFKAEKVNNRIKLSWITPKDPDFRSAFICFLSSSGYPQTPFEGSKVVQITNSQDTAVQYVFEDYRAGYKYFSAFSMDKVENYSLPVYSRILIQDRPLKLAGNYIEPDKGRKSVLIHLDAATEGMKVRIKVFNLKGKVMKDWGETQLKAGRNTFQWPGDEAALKDTAPGVYILSVTGDIEAKERIMVVK